MRMKPMQPAVVFLHSERIATERCI